MQFARSFEVFTSTRGSMTYYTSVMLIFVPSILIMVSLSLSWLWPGFFTCSVMQLCEPLFTIIYILLTVLCLGHSNITERTCWLCDLRLEDSTVNSCCKCKHIDKSSIPYLFTYKAHSVIRRTLNFRRRLWQVSKMKISPKYPVIRRTQNYGKFCWPHRCTYNNLLPKVTYYCASIFKTIAKESHMDNSIKVTLFNSLKSSFKAIERAKRTHSKRSPQVLANL